MDTKMELEVPLEARDADAVRHRVAEAFRQQSTFASMNIARQVAEAVCIGIGPKVPEEHRGPFTRGNLGPMLDKLESLSKPGNDLGLTREVLAGLRTLQAFGNYASHYDPKAHSPSRSATASAMASLALVARWHLGRGMTPLKPNSPSKPWFIERFGLRRGVGTPPELHLDPLVVADSSKVTLDQKLPPSEQLSLLSIYIGRAARVGEQIVKAILRRETTLTAAEIENCSLSDLSMHLSVLSDERPGIVPRTVWADFDGLVHQRSQVTAAIASDERNHERVAALVAGVSLRDLADALNRWFVEHYLGGTVVEVFFASRDAWFFLLLVAVALGFAYGIGHDAGQRSIVPKVPASVSPDGGVSRVRLLSGASTARLG